MLITCPNCSAKFDLPNADIPPTARLRCSFCNHSFSVQEGTQVSDDILENNDTTVEEKEVATAVMQEKSNEEIIDDAPLPVVPVKKTRAVSISIFVFLSLFAIAAAWVFTLQYKKQTKLDTIVEDPANTMQTMIKDLSIKDYRQYFVTTNKHIEKPFFVVEGRIKNNSTEPKAFIVVRASLFNNKGEVLADQEMLAGVALSLFQLQTMKEEEMESMLKDPLEIAVTNSNVLPQGEVPFMLLFFDPPRDVAEFSVQILSATKAEDLGKR